MQNCLKCEKNEQSHNYTVSNIWLLTYEDQADKKKDTEDLNDTIKEVEMNDIHTQTFSYENFQPYRKVETIV